jgi:TonB-dependent starch-binding outer membrane protein SusC
MNFLLRVRWKLGEKLAKMKLIIALFLCFSLQGFTESFAQRISLSGEYAFEKALAEIEKQSGYTFFYNYDLIRNAKNVRFELKNALLEDALNSLLKDQPLTYTIQNKVIVLRSKVVQPTSTNGSGPIPPVEIRGRVINDDGETLSGAVVNLKGGGKTAVTNDKGEFTLTLEPAEATLGTLVITYVGYLRKEIRINSRKDLQISLEKNIEELKNVVVTSGYGRPKRKEEVVGSVSTVTSKELQTQRPIESFDKMLEGLAAGVQVQTNTELGTPVKINIRGQNSLTNLYSSRVAATSSQPLFVIDGVPVVEQRRGDEPIAFINNEQLLNPLAGINPADIESISVLKDAAATSIYGANASNGVIIITTKKGRAGKTKINVGYSYGWSQPVNQIKWLSGEQYHELVKELYINIGRDPYTAELLAGPSDINTNWFGLTNQYGNYHNVDFDMSGGNETTQFRLSGVMQDQQSIQKGNDYKKFSFNLRLDQALTPKLNLTATLSPSFIQKNALNVYSNVPIIPNVPAYNADGTFYQLGALLVPNPLAVLAQNVDYHTGGTMNGSVRLNLQATKHLQLSSSFGISGLINKQNIFQSGKNATGATKNGFAEIYDRTNFAWVSFTQAAWRQRIKQKHGIDITAGFEAQSQNTRLLRGSGSGFTYYRLNELSNAQNQNAASSKQISNSYSFYGQAAYDFDTRYFLNVSGRYDAASIFGPDFNATVNAAIGAGWNISKEKFLRDKSFIDLLRVRLSYGSTGNSRIGSYQAKGIYSFNNDGYNGYTSSSPSSAPNPDLGWEKGYKFNAGIDFSFLKRFNFTLDFYNNVTDDAISSIQVPVINGFSTTLANTAKMRNRGFDASLSAQIFNRAFTWTSTFNAGFNRNLVLDVKNDQFLFSTNELASALREGYSTSAIWGFKYAGVDQQNGEALYVTNKGTIVPLSQLDRSIGNSYIIGDRLPDLQGGFINTFGYKNFSLNVLLTYSFGGQDLIDYNLEADGNNLTNRNASVNLLDRWQKPGQVTNVARLRQLPLPVVNSTRYMYDASFIKVQNVSLSYTVPAIRQLRGLRATVFANATNLAYWYKEKSPAGRNGYREYRFGAFPESQTYNWGVRFNF